MIIEIDVVHVLISQLAIKTPRPDKINFKILQMIWDWDKIQITNLVQNIIRLSYHPKEWKKDHEILLEKVGK